VSVSEWVCHTKRVERSTGRNVSQIFTKLAIMVLSQEMWLPIVLVEIRNTYVRQTGSWIIFIIAPVENTFNVKYVENGERYAYVMVINKLFGSMAWF